MSTETTSHVYRVKLFGPQAQLAGTQELAIALPTGCASTDELLAAIDKHAADLSPSLASSRLAINHAYAGPDDKLKPEDEIALIGMVSGG